MKLLVYFILTLGLASQNSLVCFAQTASIPTTLEGVANQEDATQSKQTVAHRNGILVRPRNGARHPDLDRAWAGYAASAARVTADLKAAITKQFDAATTKGDLDAAVKWKDALTKWEQFGEFPNGKETNKQVSAAKIALAKSAATLEKSYNDVIASLTKAKRIAVAQLVQSEWKQLESNIDRSFEKSISPDDAKALAERVLSISPQEWEKIPGRVFTVAANLVAPIETGIVLRQSDRHLFLPCPSDRWNSNPAKASDVDFQGHDIPTRARNGMRFMRLCYSIDDGPLRYVLESWEITGVQGALRFAPSDVSGGGDNANNRGSVRVKVISIR